MKTNITNKVEELGSQSAHQFSNTKSQTQARKAVEATVAKLSTPTGGDLTAKDEAEKAARVEKQDTRLPIDTEARKENRKLPTPKVLSLLHTQLPAAYRVAEVVGKWVWVQFKQSPAAEVRQALAQLGFHWNRERQAWQHPCGKFSLGSSNDPHERYTSYKPAFLRRKAKTETPEPVAA